MKILFLTPVVPYPLTDGGRQRIHYLLEALTEDHEVSLAALGQENLNGAWPIARRLLRPPIIVARDQPVRSTSLTEPLHRAARLGWWGRPRNVQRLARSGLWERIRADLDHELSVVHAETSLMAPLAIALKRSRPCLKLVLDLPDVMWHYKARALRNRSWLSASVLRDGLDVLRTRFMEDRSLPCFDRILVCSEIDRERVQARLPHSRITVVPNCTDTTAPPLPAPPDSRKLIFVGTMSYEPNEDGVLFFAAKVLPLIRQQVPDVQFWIVGKNPSPVVTALKVNPGVHVTGSVDDVRPYLEQSAAVVVPLRGGGGTRLKILEAMAAQRAVVSTTIGAEGIDATPGEHILIGDTPESLANDCVRLVCDRKLREKIARAGRALSVAKYDWRIAQQKLLATYAELR